MAKTASASDAHTRVVSGAPDTVSGDTALDEATVNEDRADDRLGLGARDVLALVDGLGDTLLHPALNRRRARMNGAGEMDGLRERSASNPAACPCRGPRYALHSIRLRAPDDTGGSPDSSAKCAETSGLRLSRDA